MSITTSAMAEGYCILFEQKARNRTAIPRPLRYMDAQAAVAVGISQSICINTILKKVEIGTRS